MSGKRKSWMKAWQRFTVAMLNYGHCAEYGCEIKDCRDESHDDSFHKSYRSGAFAAGEGARGG